MAHFHNEFEQSRRKAGRQVVLSIGTCTAFSAPKTPVFNLLFDRQNYVLNDPKAAFIAVGPGFNFFALQKA
jgi:hypothetical protein